MSTQETKDKDLKLWEEYQQNPNKRTLRKLMDQLDPLIQNQVNKWSGALAREALVSKAENLAYDAIQDYDPDRGAALSTHVMNRLQKLSRDVYNHRDAVRIPEYKQIKFDTYRDVYEQLKGRLGRDPTDDELADELGWSKNKLRDVQKLDHEEFVESEDVGAGMFESDDVWGDDAGDLTVDYIYHDLDPQEKLIFEHKTGYSGKPMLSNQDLRDKMDMTQGQLSYRQRKIRDKVQNKLDDLEKVSQHNADDTDSDGPAEQGSGEPRVRSFGEV